MIGSSIRHALECWLEIWNEKIAVKYTSIVEKLILFLLLIKSHHLQHLQKLDSSQIKHIYNSSLEGQMDLENQCSKYQIKDILGDVNIQLAILSKQ